MRKSPFGLRELRAHQQRHHAAGEEEHARGDDVEDPDPLVVDGDEPARDAAALPGGHRRRGDALDVNCHRAPPPPGSRSAPRICASSQSLPTGGIAPAALADDLLDRRVVVEQLVPAAAAGRCRPRRRARGTCAQAPVERLLAELGRARLLRARLPRRASRRTRRAAAPRPRPSSPRAGGRRTRRTGRGTSRVVSALNQVTFVTPGIASNLPPSAGIHQEWMTSKSGAVTSSRTVWPTGARSWSIAMTPFG